MKRTFLTMLCLAVISTGMLLVSCDWSGGGSDGFNTSRQNQQVNLSGVYRGQLDGGKAVSNPSGGTITQLIMSQSGNVLEISDNQGSTYRGVAGTPTVLASGDSTIPAGAELASYIVSFEGLDRVSNQNVRFTGNIEIVTVTDVDGTDETVTTTNDDNATVETINNSGTQNTTTSNNDQINNSTTTTQNDSTTTTNSDTVQVNETGGTQQGNFGETETDMTTSTTTTTRDSVFGGTSSTEVQNNTTVNNTTVNTTDNQVNRTDTTTTGNNVTTTTTRTFSITGSTFQYRLRGSWIEDNGSVSGVDALSPAAGGIFTVPIGQQNGGGAGAAN